MRISDWSSDVCSSDLLAAALGQRREHGIGPVRRSCPQVAEDQVLVDGEVAEHLPPLRNIGTAGAGDRERRLAVDAGAGEADADGTRAWQPHHRPHHRGLADAVTAEYRTPPAGCNPKTEALQHGEP